MDAEGLGCKLLLTPSVTPEKQPVGVVTASHKMLTLQALSNSLNAGTAKKKNSLGREKAFRGPPAVCPPERPRPFTHCRKIVWKTILLCNRCACKFSKEGGPHLRAQQRYFSYRADACSDSIAKLFRACFCGVSHRNRAICCKMGYRRDVPV